MVLPTLDVLDALAAAVALVAGLEVMRRHAAGTVRNLVGLLCLLLAAIAAARLAAGLTTTPEIYWHARLGAATAAALATGALVTLGAALGFAPRHPWPIALGGATVAVIVAGGLALAPAPIEVALVQHQVLLQGAVRRIFGGLAMATASAAFVAGALIARGNRGRIARRRLLIAAAIQGGVGLVILAASLAGAGALALAVPVTVALAATGHAVFLGRFRPVGLPGDALSALFDRAADPMVFLNLDADEALANPAARTLLCDPPADPAGMIRRLGLGDDLEILRRRCLAARSAGRAASVSLGARSFEISLSCADEARVCLIHLAEVTERVRAQEAAEQALADLADAHERMVVQEKMAALGSLISGVSHEINNPVAYVSSNLRVLREYLDDLKSLVDGARDDAPGALAAWARSPEAAETLEDAAAAIDDGLDGCDRIRTIVGSMRTLSRENEPEQDADLAALARQAVKVARTSVNPSIQVLTYLSEALPIRAVPGEISRVISNLVVNAGQALDGNGTITVAGWTEGDTAVVEVADDGPGIPEALRTRIFEPFFTTKGPGEGTGLGLSISYETVRRHRGELVVHSTLGDGTRFQVRLPAADSGDDLGPDPATGRPGGGAATERRRAAG